MYNAATKILLAICLSASIYSCGNQKSEEQKYAEQYLSEAQSLFNNKQYDRASIMLDSLMKTYPGVIDVQRNAMHLRTLITEQVTIADSISNDSVIAANKNFVDSVSKRFKFVKTKDMVEGYYLNNSIALDNLTKRTDIEARIDEQGNIYLISSLYGKPIKHTSLIAKCNKEEARTKEIAYDNAKNYRFKDGNTSVEMVTFNKEACDTFCQFITRNIDNKIVIEFSGRGKHSIVLSDRSKKAIAETYEFADRKAILKKSEDLKIYYSRKLQITRRQSRMTATNIKGDSSK